MLLICPARDHFTLSLATPSPMAISSCDRHDFSNASLHPSDSISWLRESSMSPSIKQSCNVSSVENGPTRSKFIKKRGQCDGTLEQSPANGVTSSDVPMTIRQSHSAKSVKLSKKMSGKSSPKKTMSGLILSLQREHRGTSARRACSRTILGSAN